MEVVKKVEVTTGEDSKENSGRISTSNTISIAEIALREEKSCFCICEYGN